MYFSCMRAMTAIRISDLKGLRSVRCEDSRGWVFSVRVSNSHRWVIDGGWFAQ